MVLYELYCSCSDPIKEYELLGILPERRKDPRRKTDASIINWGRMLLGNKKNKKNIVYKKVTVSECPGKVFRIQSI